MKQQFENVFSFLDEIGKELDKKRKLNPPESLIDESLKPFMSKGEDYESHGHILFRFENDYGASVVHGPGTYGLELEKLIFIDGEEDIDYDICGEPHGYLEKEKMNELLHKIKNGEL